MSYPIGTPGQPWGHAEREAWRMRTQRQRSYVGDVLAALSQLGDTWQVEPYAEIAYAPARFTVMSVRNTWHAGRPLVMVTGGVHGYETSGVLGTLSFLRSAGLRYAKSVNLLVVPCVSPWAWERIQRWNHDALDPNRNFQAVGVESPAQESAALMRLVAPLRGQIAAHIDLHETTDSDETEFGPARAARDGNVFVAHGIPDGFYAVDDSGNPQPAFQAAILEAVAKVTHIAPADARGEIIGSPVVAPGVIHYDMVGLGLCAGISGARYTCTTEVYPDSPRATPEQCIAAQVAAACAGIEFVLAAS